MSDMALTKYRAVDGGTIRSDNAIRERRYMHGSGTIVREYPSSKASKSQCCGCRNDFYNGRQNITGDECWSFKSARVVDKIGHSTLNVCNGPDTIMRKTLSCWSAVSR